MLFTNLGKYTMALVVGSPPTTYNLVVSTGSAVTWVGAQGSTPYEATHAIIDTEQRVGETYGGGASAASFSGTFFLDTVTLGPGLTINYELAVASTSKNVRYDGIFGIGPQDLTAGTLTDNRDRTYATFTQRLADAGAIGKNVVGIFFEPITGNRDTNVGELTFGDPDYTKCTSDIEYTDVTDTPPSKKYWGINQRVTYGTTEILLYTAGIIDTSSRFIKISSDAYGRYQDATGATFDQPTGLLRVTSNQYSALRPLNFHIGNKIFSLTPDAQIWPRSLNHKFSGGENDGIYLIVEKLPTETGAGLDFIAGYPFMQRFYTVLDSSLDNRRVGFATTPFTDAITNYLLKSDAPEGEEKRMAEESEKRGTRGRS
ncbi:aspartic peptidase domain-containing protein [Suillus spraguei]|nr:aspartic peptidase domain-containing protein [Suillus spraguei]